LHQRQIILQVPVIGDLPVLHAIDVNRAKANLAAVAFQIFKGAGEILPAFTNTDFMASVTLVSWFTSMAINSTRAMGFARRRSLTVPNVRAPRSANNRAVSRPIPDERPVTRATVFAVMFNILLS
jgi:hypothetical protein